MARGTLGYRKGNKYVIEGEVAKVYFSNADGYFLCDTKDVEILNRYTWYLGCDGYARSSLRRKTIFAHIILLGKPEGMEIDHINRNKLDNRRNNLRLVTHTVNMRNTSITKRKNVGVWFVKGKYRAGIHQGNKTINLGSFGTEEEAIRARKEAEIFYWGEQANEA